MKDWTAIQQRYMRDGLPVRLGGLAANLGRIKSFATREGNREAVESLTLAPARSAGVGESKYFIEWTAAEAEIDIAAALVELQVQLARWQHNWPRIWADPAQRSLVAEQSSAWSKRVLEMSGLLAARGHEASSARSV